jgi:signal transduction histidine kinase
MALRVGSLDRKWTLSCFRFILWLVLTYFFLQGGESQGQFRLVAGLLAGYLASVVLGGLAPSVWYSRAAWLGGVFIFDLAYVSVVIYLTQGFESDLYLAYFLVILASMSTKKPQYSFLVGFLASGVYLSMSVLVNERTVLLDPVFLLRLPFLWLVSFISSYLLYENQRDQREFEAFLRRQEAHSEKMAYLGKLAAQMAHEVANPLASVMIHIDLLAAEAKKGSALAEKLALVRREMDRGLRLTRGWLDWARPAERRAEPVDLSGLLRRTADVVRPRLEENRVALSLEVPDGLRLAGHEASLEQVFLNLLTNALQAMPDGGKLRVAAARDRRPAAWRPNLPVIPLVDVTVSDTGLGIPPDDLPRLFEPFFTTRKDTGGTGLGLAVTAELVARHGGLVRAFSDGPGRGARFVVTLPEVPD